MISSDAAFTDDEELQVSAAKVALANGTGSSCQAYIAEAGSGAGVSYAITASGPTTLTLSGSPSNVVSTFWVYKTITQDITKSTAGATMASGNRILTLRDADAALNPYALPDTTDATGSDTYGKDGYWFDKAALRAAVRGGNFNNTGNAGVFALRLRSTPSDASDSLGFRACKVR
ncbi:MAG: hypothetical protein BWX80_03435 [Candidatus Hydrogenedentes bacterium ADurb.Bin101]|nr:MAG: hypothetical protein BWX80_03435 [Candidatus Hydrogenedentes bacterium ADurb.Bin101]